MEDPAAQGPGGGHPQPSSAEVPMESAGEVPDAGGRGGCTAGTPAPPTVVLPTQEEVDAERGFTDAELATCLKVLHAFRDKLDILQQKEYRALRSAGIIFVEGISKRYFKGLSPEEYNHNKARKAARKERRKHEALEDQRRLATTKMREQKLRRMERLMEGATASPAPHELMLESAASAEGGDRTLTLALKAPSTEVDPLTLGVVTVAPDRVHIRFSSTASADKKRKRKSQQQQQKQEGERQIANKNANKGKAKGAQAKTSPKRKTPAMTKSQPENAAAQQKRAENEKRRMEIESDRMMEDDVAADAPSPAPPSAGAAEGQTLKEERSVAEDGDNEDEEEVEGASEEESVLHKPEECYICKRTFHKLHHFYDRLCPPCAKLNWRKRIATANLNGYVALVTGGRVKIGFETAVILLRAGATVVVTTRFPHDAALRFSKLEDFDAWRARLHVYGLDMRYLQAVEKFCQFMGKAYNHLDIIINNAAQTIRRPPAYYEHLIAAESVHVASLPEPIRDVLQPPGLPVTPWGNDYLLPLFSTPSSSSTASLFELTAPTPDVPLEASCPPAAGGPLIEEPADDQEMVAMAEEDQQQSAHEHKTTGNESAMATSVGLPNISAVLTQLAVDKGDEAKDPKLFPPGRYDEHGQQVDLRRANSWVLQLDQVSTVELAEVHVINALAPYTINSLLRPMLNRSPNADKFIVNVSSVEGEFYHKKTTAHPHTNMAKASLNMMTRTAAAYYARDRIWMNAVDTGWISDMNPIYRSQRIANKYGEVFRNPIDEVDGAARILDPIFVRLNEGKLYLGKFLKDYRPSVW